MRMLIGAGLAAMVAGCAPQTADEAAVESAGLKSYCPDPTIGCTVSNGTGVYYEEGGYAGIGTLRLMLTHFINQGTSVRFQGRYFTPATQQWRMLPAPGLVGRADYKATKNLQVTAVSESGTEPTWTLLDPQTSAVITVSGDDLADLVLYLQLVNPVSGARQVYALEFAKRPIEVGRGTVLSKYIMRWHDTDVAHPARVYCRDGNQNEDTVVFQRGMFVNPVSGSVTRAPATADFVTLSCRQGAIATVYHWGYHYLGATAKTYFDAGIHMKRASYCGDETFYTVTGTHIRLADDLGIHSEVSSAQDPMIEAYWDEHGATCFGVQRNLTKVFSPHSCNGQPLPPCPDIQAQYNSGNHFLVDAVTAIP